MNTACPEWKFIEKLGWGRFTVNYKLVQKYLYKNYTPGHIKYVRTFVNSKVNQLYRAVETWEMYNRKLRIYSDDGLNDVIFHVVGMGEEEYTKVLEDVTLLELRYHAPYKSKNGYRESFAYCFHTPH